MRIAQFKDKVEKIVTRKAATSSASVHDDNETETKRRYNLRNRKLQDEKDHCPSNTNKNRRIIWLHNDGPTKVSKLKTNTLRRSKTGATKRTFLTEQADEKKSSHKKQKWNPGKRIPTKSLKRKIQSSMNTISNSRNIKGKQEGSRKTNPSSQKKRKAARVKRSTPEKKLQIRTQRSKKERCRKELPGMFAKMFLKKLDLVSCIKGMDENNYSQIPGISVTHDNLVWVNHLQNKKEVKLYNSAGELLRSFDLDYYPVFNSCMPNGDLLVTRIHTVGAKPIVELFSREGKTRMLADLSTHTEKLSGIIYQDERIYVIGHSCYKSSILKLDMNGEVEKVFEPKPECITIEHIISQNGQIFALKNDIFSMHLLGSDKISSEAINKVVVDKSYSASASVDNFGNIIIGVHSPGPKIVIIDPRLERKHEIRCDFSERIRSTAVDKQNHLWIGTDDGHLYIAKYLK
nr:uncharacterized protein LOC105331808 isoform X2 [Crassostrea gigas]